MFQFGHLSKIKYYHFEIRFYQIKQLNAKKALMFSSKLFLVTLIYVF